MKCPAKVSLHKLSGKKNKKKRRAPSPGTERCEFHCVCQPLLGLECMRRFKLSLRPFGFSAAHLGKNVVLCGIFQQRLAQKNGCQRCSAFSKFWSSAVNSRSRCSLSFFRYSVVHSGRQCSMNCWLAVNLLFISVTSSSWCTYKLAPFRCLHTLRQSFICFKLKCRKEEAELEWVNNKNL